MDAGTEHALQFFQGLVTAQKRIDAFMRQLQREGRMVSAFLVTSRDRDLPPGFLVGFSIASKAVRGQGLEFAVDVRWGEGAWHVEAGVARERGDEHEWLREFPTRTAAQLTGCLAHLETSVIELCSCSDLAERVEQP